jgi:hypothetical protein
MAAKSPGAELAEKLGRLLHDRAHRPGGGGIGCHDAYIVGRHAPCYTIADEIVDALPSRAVSPAADFNAGEQKGRYDAVRQMRRWVDDGGLGGDARSHAIAWLDDWLLRLRRERR